MITCGNCGAQNPEGSVFCARCDHFLEWDAGADGGDEAVEPSVAAASADEGVAADSAGDVDEEVDGVETPMDLTAASEEDLETVGAPPDPAAVTASMGPPPPRERKATPGSSVLDIIKAIDDGSHLALDHERPDLADHLAQARNRLEQHQATLVVVGEFKRGKSTLVNALLQTAVCPVDADVVTSVPTVVTYAPTAGATVYADEDGDGIVEASEISLDQVAALVSEPSEPGVQPRQRSVEVRVPHRMLKAGLRLVDTPGVGGLDSAHGFLTLGTLSMADGVLFVTDASQELTGPELEFLRSVVERCPQTAIVVTKTDLHAEWQRICDLDRQHLTDAGLHLPVFPVSSFLRLRAAMDPGLNGESGFEELVRYVATGMVAEGTSRAAQAAADEVSFVATQLAHQPRAVQSVLERPEDAPQVIERLQKSSERAASLAAPSASWQQSLADGIQDLVADVDHDLNRRLRTLIQEVEEVIESGDPKETWEDTEVWLRRQLAIAAVENRTLLMERARTLTEEVASRFELEGEQVAPLNVPGVSESLALSTPIQPLGAQTGRVAAYIMAARSAIYAPMVLFGLVSTAAASAAVPVIVPVTGVAAAALGAGIGQKMFRDEAQRQRTYRQQQAKLVARRFVDDVAFVLNKDTRDALRATQRQLREDFQGRAVSIQVSTQAALRSAERAASLDGDERTARAAEAVADEARLDALRSGLKVAAVSAAAGGVAVAAGAAIAALGGHDD
jgi:signal recognition particle receptor subunit beta